MPRCLTRYSYLCNESILKNYAFLFYMCYMHPGYWTPIFGKNRAYYISIFMVCLCRKYCFWVVSACACTLLVQYLIKCSLEFQQINNFDAVGHKGEQIRFCGQRVKRQGHSNTTYGQISSLGRFSQLSLACTDILMTMTWLPSAPLIRLAKYGALQIVICICICILT